MFREYWVCWRLYLSGFGNTSSVASSPQSDFISPFCPKKTSAGDEASKKNDKGGGINNNLFRFNSIGQTAEFAEDTLDAVHPANQLVELGTITQANVIVPDRIFQFR